MDQRMHEWYEQVWCRNDTLLSPIGSSSSKTSSSKLYKASNWNALRSVYLHYNLHLKRKPLIAIARAAP